MGWRFQAHVSMELNCCESTFTVLRKEKAWRYMRRITCPYTWKYINGRYDHQPQDLNCGVPISTRFTTPSACAVHCTIAVTISPELALLIVQPRILLPLFGLIRERSSKFGQFQVDAWHISGFLAFMMAYNHFWSGVFDEVQSLLKSVNQFQLIFIMVIINTK